LAVSIPIVTFVDGGLLLYGNLFDNGLLSGDFGNGGGGLASVLPLLVEGGNEQDVDDAGCEPGQSHHAHLDNGVDPAGGKNVSVDLGHLEDGHKDGEEVEDP